LILENKVIFEVEDDLIEEIFDFMIRDFSRFALNIHTKPSSSEKQKELSMAMIKAPIANEERFNKVWETYAFAMKGQYEMKE
jgi:acyl-CoA dehydrogenase